jgi:hypothetical protein
MNLHHQVATATFNGHQNQKPPQPSYDTDGDPRWRINPHIPPNKYNFPENYQEAEDVRQLMQKLHIPDHEETFLKLEKKNFLSHNRKQINTIDVQKNYYKAQKRGYGNY